MAKIIGNTTATPNPRPDWNQTDETKADYIRNKPEDLLRQDDLEDATNMALAKAKESGEFDGATPIKGVDYFTEEEIKDIAEQAAALVPISGGDGPGATFVIDETLTLKNGVLSVNVTHEVQEDNTLPISSAAVATTVGNIEVLLRTI